MNPGESARVARRIAHAIHRCRRPSVSAVKTDLKDLLLAVGGDKAASRRISSRARSGMPEMAELDAAFRTAGEAAPDMVPGGRGRWSGKARGVDLAVHAAPDGSVQKVLVAGRPVSGWAEAVEAVRFHAAMSDDGTLEDPEDLAAAEAELGADTFHCVKCNGPVDLEQDIDCKKCGTEYVTCPGCDDPYPMSANEGDHCPICGYSSWGELPEEASSAWIEALKAAAAKADETGEGQPASYQGFTANVSIVERGGKKFIFVSTPEDEEEAPFDEWMAEPELLCSSGLDQALWEAKNPNPMEKPKPYVKPGGGSGLEAEGGTVEVQGSGKKPYVLMHRGNVYSCSCPAWKIQKLPPEKRTCKHLKQVRGAEAEAARVGG